MMTCIISLASILTGVIIGLMLSIPIINATADVCETSKKEG